MGIEVKSGVRSSPRNLRCSAKIVLPLQVMCPYRSSAVGLLLDQKSKKGKKCGASRDKQRGTPHHSPPHAHLQNAASHTAEHIGCLDITPLDFDAFTPLDPVYRRAKQLPNPVVLPTDHVCRGCPFLSFQAQPCSISSTPTWPSRCCWIVVARSSGRTIFFGDQDADPT